MQPRTRNTRATDPFDISIDSLTHDVRGVGRHKGREVFVANAAQGDTLTARVGKRKTSLWEAVIEHILVSSPQRRQPGCPK